MSKHCSQKCSLDPDPEGRCTSCKLLNIECLGGYWKGYPLELKAWSNEQATSQALTFIMQNKERKKDCLKAIKEWTRVTANRRSPQALSIRRFCEPPPPTPVVDSPISGNTYISTPSFGGTNDYESPVSPATQSEAAMWGDLDGPGKSDTFYSLTMTPP